MGRGRLVELSKIGIPFVLFLAFFVSPALGTGFDNYEKATPTFQITYEDPTEPPVQGSLERFPVIVRNIYPVNSQTDANPTLEIGVYELNQQTPMVSAMGGLCASPDITSVQFQIAADSDFTLPVYDSGENFSDICSHVAFASLSSQTSYFWRARIRNSEGFWSSWSHPTPFSTVDTATTYINIFRDGTNSYNGTADADIRGSAQNPMIAIREWNQGAQDVLRTGRRSAGSSTDEIYRSLLAFDLTPLTDPDAVVGAYLRLTGWQHDGSPTYFQARHSIYELLKPWGEGTGNPFHLFPDLGEVSWTYTEYPSAWSLPGAADASDTNPSADRKETPLVQRNVTSQVGYLSFWSSKELIDLVKTWIANPGTNFGMLIKTNDETFQEVMNFGSRENADSYYRPKLVVISTELADYACDNLPPVATDDGDFTYEEIAVSIDVLSNDSDQDDCIQPISIDNVDDPINGTASIVSGEILYTPDTSFTGLETFDYTLTDGELTDTGTINVDVLATGAPPPRVTDNLVVLYPFDEGSGTTAADQSGNGTPLNLTLTGSYSWNTGNNGVVMAGGKAATSGAATKLLNALGSANQASFEAWIETGNLTQTGPSRIMSIGTSTSVQNYVLGQDEDDIETRLFHTGKDIQANPRLGTTDAVLTLDLIHIVHTFDGTTERLYLDGVQHPNTVISSGNLSGWNPTTPFNVGNEGSNDRPFTGIIRLVAVYDRSLSLGEIGQNYAAGPDGNGP